MPRPKLLVVELWGIGDLAMASGFLRAAAAQFEVTVLGKPHAAALLTPSFPEIRHLTWDAPWTVFRGKYRLWQWHWRALGSALHAVRHGGFDAAVSARLGDARDHLLMRLGGIPQRFGFPRPGAPRLLTCELPTPTTPRHISEDWAALGAALGLGEIPPPSLPPEVYRDATVRALTERRGRPLVCLHTGARIAVRRWPEAYFRELLTTLRRQVDFELLLIPDPDGYGCGLAPLADRTVESLNLAQLTGVLGSVDLLLCNDSAPGHLAAACGVPVCTLFGPTHPVRYRPVGPAPVQVVERDLCAFRPCFDYCRFPAPKCLLELTPALVADEIGEFFVRNLGGAPRASS